MRKLKKLNIAIILLLLVFQTVLSPISVFASENTSTTTSEQSEGTIQQADTDIGDEGSNENDNAINEEEGTGQAPESDTEEAIGEDVEEDIGEEVDGDSEEAEAEAEAATDDLEKIVPLSVGTLAAQQVPAILTSFEMKIDGKTVEDGVFERELPQDTLANFTVKFSVPMQDDQGEAWGDGSWFEFQLPKSLIDFEEAFKGRKTVNGITYDYTTTDNKVVVELSGMTLESASSQPEELTITFTSGFNNLSDEIEQELEIPGLIGGSQTIKATFTFLPSTKDKKVSKSKVGTPTPTASGNHEMEWQVWVNEAGKTLNNATLTDKATGGHVIVANSVNVYQYEVGLSGVRDQTGPGKPVLTDGDWDDIASKLTGKYAYKITYKTAVNLEADERDDVVNFNNTVTFTNAGQPNETSNQATHTITYGKALEKKLISNTNYKTTWRIDYNHNLLNIDQANAKITDTITGPHEIDASSIKVYKMNDAAGNVATEVTSGQLVNTSEYSIESVTKESFTLAFKNNISDAYTIVYEANYNKQDFYETETGSFNNSVTSGSGKTFTKPFTLTENLLSKSHKVDFDEKVISWTIEIKSDNPKKSISNLTLTDTFTANGADGTHSLVLESIKISGNTGAPTITPDADLTKGFTITGINVPAGGTAKVTYQTSFAIEDDGQVQKNGYGNTAATEWTSGDKTYKKSETSSYVPQSTTVNNGSKSGTFNYSTQEFTWDVKVNINKKDINGAVLVDTVGAGHKYVEDTIVVLPLTNLGGSDTGGTIGTTPIDPSNYTISNETDKGFTLTFNIADGLNYQAYVVRYKTIDDDNILGIGSDNENEKGNVYTNGATFKTKGTQEFTLDSTPVIIDGNVANNLITKNTPTQNATTEKITWTLDVNKSHSDLGNNVTLTDLPGNNLMLLENSIKIAPYTVTSTGITNGTTWKTPAELGWTVTFDTVGGFSIVFPDLIKKGYRVQYETVGFGKKNDPLENTATLNYTGQTMANQKTEEKFTGQFNFSSSESDFTSTRGSAKFKKVGIDSATGQFKENLANVTFQLIKKTATNEYIIKTATTDENGEFTFENVPYNAYLIREVAAPTGYDKMEDYPFKLDGETTLDSNPDLVTELVNTTPVTGCTQFKIAINDVDGTPITTGTVTLKDKNGVETGPYTVTSGEVTLPNNFTVGEYTVTHSVEGDLGKVTVKYDGTCEAPPIQPEPKCDNFTIVVEDTEGNIRTNIQELTLKSGTTEIKVSPDAAGKFIVESNKNNPTNGVKPGTYTVYEGKQYIGTVHLTYQKACGFEFIIQQAPKCETFELTVYDVDGKLVADGTSVTVKNKDNDNVVATKTTNNGVIELIDLEPGVYTVEVGGEEIDEFESNINCKAEAQPTPKCEAFTVVIKDDKGVIKPGKDVIIKDKSGNEIPTKKDGNGNLTFESKTIPAGKYDVYDKNVYLGEIEVSYAQEPCETTLLTAPVCPDFTLTINNMYSQPRVGVKVTITGEDGTEVEDNGSTEFTTDSKGQITISNSIIKPGKYIVRENGKTIIGTVIVGNTCEAKIQPTPPTTTDPGEPTDPTTNPGNPGGPTDPTTNPGKPGKPTDPTTNPGKPGEPTDPTTNPGKPGEPTDPTTNPGKPGEPTDPTTNPGKPGEPTDPTTNPGKPGEPTDSNNSTTPGKTETSKPSVQNVIDQGKNLPPYDSTKATKDTLDAYKDFLNKYNNLSKEEQAEVAKSLDIDSIKADAKRLEAQLNAKGKLPQTDGADQTALTLIGVALVLGALLLLRRRNAEIK
ncbi:collagen binding domain-containing protein [Lysinibacillus sp. NPDC097231]|uniref:collagen binding domain-containing protein n=1 Tax=Lysinibacillus sp. NPDC097231 TaxID=3364142 RepID=UPI0037F5AE29